MRFEKKAVQQRAPPPPPHRSTPHQIHPQRRTEISLEPQILAPVFRENKMERSSSAAALQQTRVMPPNKRGERPTVQKYFDSPEVSRKTFYQEPTHTYDNPEAFRNVQLQQQQQQSSNQFYENGIPERQAHMHIKELQQTIGVPGGGSSLDSGTPAAFQRSYRGRPQYEIQTSRRGSDDPERSSVRVSTGFVVGSADRTDNLKSSFQPRQSVRSQRSEVTFADEHSGGGRSRFGSVGGGVSRYDDFEYNGDPTRTSGRRSGSLSNLMFNIAREDNSRLRRTGSGRSNNMFGSRGSLRESRGSLRGSRGDIRRRSSGSFSVLIQDTLGRSRSIRSRSGSRMDLERSEEDFFPRKGRSASFHELNQPPRIPTGQQQQQMTPKKSSLKKPKQKEQQVQQQQHQVYSRSRQDLSLLQKSDNGMVFTNYTSSSSSSEDELPEVIVAQRKKKHSAANLRSTGRNHYESPNDTSCHYEQEKPSQNHLNEPHIYELDGDDKQKRRRPQDKSSTSKPNSHGREQTRRPKEEPRASKYNYEREYVDKRPKNNSRSSAAAAASSSQGNKKEPTRYQDKVQHSQNQFEMEGHKIYPIPPSPGKRALYLPIFPKKVPKKQIESPFSSCSEESSRFRSISSTITTTSSSSSRGSSQRKQQLGVRHSGSVLHHIRDDETLFQTDL